jgi:hypothetical protein
VIQYSIVRVRETRVAAVLVERKHLSGSSASPLIQLLENELSLPVMLVAQDEAALAGARAYAEFDPMPYLYELLGTSDIDWMTLPHERRHVQEA